MVRESIRMALLVALAIACASGDTGRIAVSEAGRILACRERTRVDTRSSAPRSVADLPREARLARRRADSEPSLPRSIVATELERLAILQELPDDAESAATTLVERTRELVFDHSEEPSVVAVHVDSLRALRYLFAQVRAPDAAVDLELAEMLLSARDHDPENGYHAFLLAERAVEAGRFEEARDALIEAARAERVDPELRSRSQLVRDGLRGSGVPESRIDEMLVLGGYGVSPLRPGQTLDALARELGRRGGEALTADDSAWVECWAAIAALGISLAKTSVVLEDAIEALRAETSFLDEIADVAPTVIPRDPGERRATLENRIRSLGLESAFTSESRAAFPVHDFISRAISRLDRSNREIERTRRLDDIAAAHAIALAWAVLLSSVWVAARVIERRERRRGGVETKVGDLPLFCRAFAFVLPFAAVVFAAGAGLPPFDRSAGIDRVLIGFAEPNLILLALPLIAIVLLIGSACIVARNRTRISIAAGAANFASASLAIVLVLFAVTARSLGELREKRAAAVSVLRADKFSEAFFERFGSGRS